MSATTTTNQPNDAEISASEYGKLIFIALACELECMSKKPEDWVKSRSDEEVVAEWPGQCCVRIQRESLNSAKVMLVISTGDEVGDNYTLSRSPNALIALDDDEYTCEVAVDDVVKLETVIDELHVLKRACVRYAEQRSMMRGLAELRACFRK